MLKRLLHTVLLMITLLFATGVWAQNAYKSEKDLKKNANILFEKGDYIAALPLFSQLLSLYPKEAIYSYKFGVCMLMADKRDIEKPIKYLEAAIHDDEVERQLFYFLGLAYHYNFRFKEAINYYNRFLQSAPRTLHKKFDAARQIEMCYNGIALLSTVNDLYVLEKHNVGFRNFHRSYNVKDFGGRFLSLPPELLSKIDKKNEHNPIVFYNDKTEYLYFSSFGSKDETGKDLWRVARSEDGSWGTPEKLPEIINTGYDEDYPFLLNDGQTLFFSSKGHNSMGGYDVFRTVLDTATGTWSKPENLDFAINTPFDDILFITDNDMQTAYFASNRVSDIGMINVYRVHLESRFGTEELALGDVFNLSKDDPAYKRTLELLRNRTQLEVNATEAMFERTVAEVKEQKTNEDKTTTTTTKETEKTELSDADIIKMAYDQADEVRTELLALKEKMQATKEVTEQRKQRALVRLNDAKKAREEAERVTNPRQRENAMIEASKVQAEADRLSKEAEVAESIYNDISTKVARKEEELKEADTFAENIKKAIESDSPENAIAILNQMSEEIASEDVSNYTSKTTEEILAEADKSIPEVIPTPANETEKLISEVKRLTSEAERLRKEAAQNKNKDMKDDLLAQAESFENEAREIQSEINQLTQAEATTTELVANQNTNATVDATAALSAKAAQLKTDFGNHLLKMRNQQAYLLSRAQEKAAESNADYIKAQQLLNEAAQASDAKLKSEMQKEARENLDNATKNTTEALALIEAATRMEEAIKATESEQGTLQKEIDKINALLVKNDTAKASKLIEETTSKYTTDAVVLLSDNAKTELLIKASKNEEEAEKQEATAKVNYSKIEENNKRIEDLKREIKKSSVEKDKADINKEMARLEKENDKLRAEADNAYTKSSELRLEASKLKMEVAISTSVIPEATQSSTPPQAPDAKALIETQKGLIVEQTKIIENEQRIKAEVYAERATAQEVAETQNADNNTKEDIRNKVDELRNAYSELIETFEVKAEKLYQYANDKNKASAEGLSQADLIKKNAQNMSDPQQRALETEKADNLYKKAFELAREALAALSLAKDYDNSASQMKNERDNFNTRIAGVQRLNEAGNTTAANEMIETIQNDYKLNNTGNTFEDAIRETAENVITRKEAEANTLLNSSTTLYEEARKLLSEAETLMTEASNTTDLTERNKMLSEAQTKQKQADEARSEANENLNKGEKLKIEVGVLRMKVTFTTNVDAMPTASEMTNEQKAEIASATTVTENKIDSHDFSETNTEATATTYQTQKVSEELASNTSTNTTTQATQETFPAQPYVRTTDDVKSLEDEKERNARAAAEERRKAQQASDMNERMNIEAKAAQYEENVKAVQVHIYEVNSKENTAQIEKNKEAIEAVRVQSDSDDNAIRARLLENEALLYEQKAETRLKEAENTADKSLKANLLEDALRNEQTALTKQQEAINYYKKASESIADNQQQEQVRKQEEAQRIQQEEQQRKQQEEQQRKRQEEQQRLQREEEQKQQQLLAEQNKQQEEQRRREELERQRRTEEERQRRNEQTAENTQTTNTATTTSTTQQSTASTSTDNRFIGNIKGLFFTVQIGVFGGSRTDEQLFNLTPIYYDKMGNGNFRYFSGIFASRDAAVTAKNRIITRGFPDAFVTAYYNGLRISVADALAMLQSGTARLQDQIAFTDGNTGNSPQTTTTARTQETATPAATGFYYTVQIGVYKQQRGSSQLFNISPITYESLPNGYQRHMSGTYSKRSDADNARNDIVRKGISDAFVVAYLNGKRISLADARSYEQGGSTPSTTTATTTTTTTQQQNTTTQTTTQNQTTADNTSNTTNTTQESPYNKADIVFKVQIGAFSKPVTSLILTQYRTVTGENIEEIKTDAGLTIYLVGNFKEFLEASALRNKVVNNGITDAFVVAYHKNTRIPLNTARELTR